MNRTHLKFALIGMWTVVGLTVAGVSAAVWLMRRPPHTPAFLLRSTVPEVPSELPVLFDTPDFSLTDQSGKPFTASRLHGKVWVADFIFTNCTTICPIMTREMRDIQTRIPGVDLVSFSVDPERDTPTVLQKYAELNAADPARWHFLTGDKAVVWDLSGKMKLAVGPGDGDQVMHDRHLLLVDTAGKVRAIYDSRQSGFVSQMTADVSALLKASHP